MLIQERVGREANNVVAVLHDDRLTKPDRRFNQSADPIFTDVAVVRGIREELG